MAYNCWNSKSIGQMSTTVEMVDPRRTSGALYQRVTISMEPKEKTCGFSLIIHSHFTKMVHIHSLFQHHFFTLSNHSHDFTFTMLNQNLKVLDHQKQNKKLIKKKKTKQKSRSTTTMASSRTVQTTNCTIAPTRTPHFFSRNSNA